MSSPRSYGRISVTSSRSLARIKAAFFDTRKIERSLYVGIRKPMSRFGSFVRTASMRSIKKRKDISEPGKPPTNRTGLLKKFIFFSYDEKTKSVVIGPMLFRAGSVVPRLLEKGGSVPGNGKVLWVTNPTSRDDKGRFVSEGRSRVVVNGMMNYRPRPYMRPAFDKELPGFLQSLKDQIR